MFVQLTKSSNVDKKYTAIFYNDKRKKVKTVHFGAAGMSDYTIHKDKERKMLYLQRHYKNENWEDYMTAGSLSRWILWNKTSLSESYNDYIRHFGLTKY